MGLALRLGLGGFCLEHPTLGLESLVLELLRLGRLLDVGLRLGRLRMEPLPVGLVPWSGRLVLSRLGMARLLRLAILRLRLSLLSLRVSKRLMES